MANFTAAEFRKENLFRLSPLSAIPSRARVICNSHAFQPEDDCQRYGDFTLYESVVDPAWPPGSPAPCAAPLWRQSRPPGLPLPPGMVAGPGPLGKSALPPVISALATPTTLSPTPLPFFTGDDACLYSDSWRDSMSLAGAGEPSPLAHMSQACQIAGSAGGAGMAVTTPNGIMSLRLHDRVRVDMTVDRAVRVINHKNNIVLALGGSGASAALLHPNGRTYQYGSRVEIMAHDARGNNKFAKMWYKGVSFTSEQCALVYLVDAAGTRTTTDNFSDMSQDVSLTVFYNESRHGPGCISEAVNLLESGQYWVTDEGIENWLINGVRVSQTPDGLVRVARNSNKYQVRTSPSNGTASLTTPFLHCTASLGQTSHLFVRRGERRMHYDGTSFIVRNAGHSAGFDEKNQLKVY